MSDRTIRLPAPADADHLGMMFGHHVWATLALLDRCLELTPEQLDLGAPGSFGTIRETLRHLVRADGRYLRRVLGRPLEVDQEPEPSLSMLRSEMEEQGRQWEEVLGRLGELDCTLPPQPDEDPPYPAVEHAVSLVLVQAVHHGNEHRTNVTSILSAHGLPAPEVSGWEYVRATGGGTDGST